MSSSTVRSRSFAHEALIYAGEEGFLDGLIPFIREGIRLGEPTLVVVSAPKLRLLREALNGESKYVLLADLATIGPNPARIIPLWQDFLSDHGAKKRPLRGVGEPLVAGRRSDAEIAESQRHEALLNVAFSGAPGWHLLCPYDSGSLPASVIAEALRTHPLVRRNGTTTASDHYYGDDRVMEPFALPLPPAPDEAETIAFDATVLAECRRRVYRRAADAGLGVGRTNDLVLAVNELLTNSVRHGGGAGVLRIWQDDRSIVCEVRDRGRIDDPLVDRRRPDPQRPRGRGLWIANQLCDLVQIRSFVSGNVVRLSMHQM